MNRELKSIKGLCNQMIKVSAVLGLATASVGCSPVTFTGEKAREIEPAIDGVSLSNLPTIDPESGSTIANPSSLSSPAAPGAESGISSSLAQETGAQCVGEATHPVMGRVRIAFDYEPINNSPNTQIVGPGTMTVQKDGRTITESYVLGATGHSERLTNFAMNSESSARLYRNYWIVGAAYRDGLRATVGFGFEDRLEQVEMSVKCSE